MGERFDPGSEAGLERAGPLERDHDHFGTIPSIRGGATGGADVGPVLGREARVQVVPGLAGAIGNPGEVVANDPGGERAKGVLVRKGEQGANRSNVEGPAVVGLEPGVDRTPILLAQSADRFQELGPLSRGEPLGLESNKEALEAFYGVAAWGVDRHRP